MKGRKASIEAHFRNHLMLRKATFGVGGSWLSGTRAPLARMFARWGEEYSIIIHPALDFHAVEFLSLVQLRTQNP